jgi:hypothetical protein
LFLIFLYVVLSEAKDLHLPDKCRSFASLRTTLLLVSEQIRPLSVPCPALSVPLLLGSAITPSLATPASTTELWRLHGLATVERVPSPPQMSGRTASLLDELADLHRRQVAIRVRSLSSR